MAAQAQRQGVHRAESPSFGERGHEAGPSAAGLVQVRDADRAAGREAFHAGAFVGLQLQIFGNAITGFHTAQARAWAGALTLIGIVLIFTIAARLIGRRGLTKGRS